MQVFLTDVIVLHWIFRQRSVKKQKSKYTSKLVKTACKFSQDGINRMKVACFGAS